MADGDTRMDAPAGSLSPWLDGPATATRQPLDVDARADVCVIGGGIVGISAALELHRAGAEVLLVEARRIGAGVTGNTTAKLSALQGLSYHSLVRHFDADTAATYAEANLAGIARIAAIADELGVECELRRKPAITYTEEADQLPKIEAEVEAAAAAGLPVSFTEQSDLPFAIAGAVRCENQAEFHPVKYVRGVADRLEADGVRLHEATMATDVSGGRVTLATGATVAAEHVIVATHLPFLDRGLYFARLHPERSYALGVRVDGVPPQGMYLSAGSPTRSIRSHPLGDGELLIVGGESHKAGQGDPSRCYRALERDARERFGARRVEYRWAAHDNMSPDGMPMIGRLWPGSSNLLCATGMRKWGLAMGASGGRILADLVAGRETAWTEAFDPVRLSPSSAPEVLKENANVGWRFFRDRVAKRGPRGAIAPGEGRVVGSGLSQRAVYRDLDGTLHELSARCTHLGCIVNWNAADGTWDCPCHGSRFGPRGEVVNGPATSPLEERDERG